ncbi:MAG: LptF/LptG family permease [Pseudomonadota bacterium]
MLRHSERRESNVAFLAQIERLFGVRSLDKYILRQCIIPLASMLVISTLIVWMTQVLQRVDIIVEYGQGFGVFAFLSILIIPSLLAVIIPFAIFGAIVYALYRLQTDSEIAVMFAAGVSRMRIVAPIMVLTAIGALATVYVNIDLMPRSYRVLKQSVANIRADVASSILRSGEFTALGDGFTVYIDDARPGNQFIGLLINDYRNGDAPETYLAQRALLRDTDEGTLLFLRNGNIQRVSPETGEVSFIRFEEWSINISSLRDGPAELQLELTERYLGELFNPDLSKPYDRENAAKLIAEGHARLAAPIYAFAYAFIGLYALIGGAYSRQGFVLRVAAAGVTIFVLRVAGFLAQGFAENTGFHALQYAIPTLTATLFALLLFDWPVGRAKPTSAEVV